MAWQELDTEEHRLKFWDENKDYQFDVRPMLIQESILNRLRQIDGTSNIGWRWDQEVLSRILTEAIFYDFGNVIPK